MNFEQNLAGFIGRSLADVGPHLSLETERWIPDGSMYVIVVCSICQTRSRRTALSFSMTDRPLLDEVVAFIEPHFHFLGIHDEAAAERYIQLAER